MLLCKFILFANLFIYNGQHFAEEGGSMGEVSNSLTLNAFSPKFIEPLQNNKSTEKFAGWTAKFSQDTSMLWKVGVS